MQVVEYQRSMGSHTTAIGAHETSFHCIGEDIHVIHSRVVDMEFGIDIETIRGWLYVRHSWSLCCRCLFLFGLNKKIFRYILLGEISRSYLFY